MELLPFRTLRGRPTASTAVRYEALGDPPGLAVTNGELPCDRPLGPIKKLDDVWAPVPFCLGALAPYHEPRITPSDHSLLTTDD
jgi:hypothetical protein